MTKFKDPYCHISTGKPAEACVEKEIFLIRTEIFTEPRKKRVIRYFAFLKHDIKSERSTLVQNTKLWINKWTKVANQDGFLTS